MTLVDTSAWIEYLRATGSPQHHALRDMIRQRALLHTTDVVIMEVLAGGRDDGHTARLRRLMMRCTFLPTTGLDDFETAAALYRRCRRAGDTPRALNDCLVAAVAIRAGLTVVHADRDFDVIARHTALRLAPL
jgi:predicted nucleic acid-binding protein